jgi:hypothetical protein
MADFTGRKTGLIIPYWLADRLSDGLEFGKGKGGQVLRWGICQDINSGVFNKICKK